MTIHSSAFDDQENRHASCIPAVHQSSRNPLMPINSDPKATKSKKVSELIHLFGRSLKPKVSYSGSSERFGLHL
jgi:hypothetical protein